MAKIKKYIKQNYLIKWLCIIIAYIWFGMWNLMFFLCKTKNNKIVISNFYGKGYGDNPKYVAEALLNLTNKLDIVWLVSDDLINQFPQGIRTVKIYSIKSIYELLTSKVWIDNCRKYFFYNLLKKSDTLYINVWHGGVGFKRTEQDAEESLSTSYIISAKYDSKMCNYFIADNKWQFYYIKKYYWYNGDLLKTGMPRNDKLFFDNPKIKSTVYEFYNLNKDVKTILFAPTFRKNNTKSVFMDFQKLKSSLEEKFGGTWIILLRLHPNIRAIKLNLPSYVVNVSLYEDGQDLLCAADMLISDYSSIMFDMLILNKPVFIYANDINDYIRDRSFTFRFDELPFSIAQNNQELTNNILNFDIYKYQKDIKIFKDKIQLYGNGTASIKIAEKIIDFMKL